MDPVFGDALASGRADDLVSAWHACDLRGSIDAERIAPLLAGSLGTTGELARCPPGVRTFLTAAARAAAALELLQRRELVRLAASLSAAGVPPLVFKGAALAYTCYAEPSWRPREDTDLLVAAERRDAADAALVGLGYRRASETTGRWITRQAHYERIDAGARHAVDLHLAPFNPHLFSGVLPVEAIQSDAVPIPAIPGALAPSALHSLLIAAVHRIAHHDGADELLWLFDIRLLCDDASSETFERLVDLAVRGGVAAITATALDLAARRVGARVPPAIVDRLRSAGQGEATARYLDGDLLPSDVLWADIRVMPGWRARLQAVGEHLFPPRDYIAAKYHLCSPLAVSLAYGWRILRAAPGWLYHGAPIRGSSVASDPGRTDRATMGNRP